MEDSGTVRTLDKYVGSSLCLLFSALHRLRLRKKPETIKNVLIIELFEMGAAIMAYPSLTYMREQLDNPNIYVLTLDRIKSSWEILKTVPDDHYFTITSRNIVTFGLSMLKQIWQLRRRRIDLIIDFELFMRIPTIISYLIRSKLRAGFNRYKMEGLYRGSFYDITCAFNQNTHIAKNFLALTKAAIHQEKHLPNYKGPITAAEIKIPKYRSNSALRATVIEKLKECYPYTNNDLYVISPDVGPVLPVRNYPKDYLVTVITELLNQNKKALAVLIGLEENLPICTYIQEKTDNKRCINFCGKTASVFELMELLSLSKLTISNDNGHAHFASLTDTRLIALFSTDSPYMYGPIGNCVILYSHFQCSPCISAFNHKSSVCRNNLCLQAIQPETVLHFCRAILKGKLTYRTINNEIPYL